MSGLPVLRARITDFRRVSPSMERSALRREQQTQLQNLNADMVLLRARRVALRGLPEVASLSCGCNRDRLCRVAAELYQFAAAATYHESKRCGDDFLAHRQPLFPGQRTRLAITRGGVFHAAQILAGQP